MTWCVWCQEEIDEPTIPPCDEFGYCPLCGHLRGEDPWWMPPEEPEES